MSESTGYRCEECLGVSSSYSWNTATRKVYGNVIELIQDVNFNEYEKDGSRFACPKCGSKNHVEDGTITKEEGK